MVHPLEADSLAAMPGVRHGFFSRNGGVSAGIYASLNCGPGSADDPEAVAENRARVARHLGAPHSSVVTLYQVHGAEACAVDAPLPRERLPKADAIVTATPGLAVGVLTADCAPVLLAGFDAAGRRPVVAAAHAGWRGALAGVLDSAVAAMEKLGARRRTICAAVGPCISQMAYEVGPEFESAVLADSADNRRFFLRTGAGSRPRFDLPGYAASRLRRAGVDRIEMKSACTYEGESVYFSYRRSQHRREPDYGRQISAIVIA